MPSPPPSALATLLFAMGSLWPSPASCRGSCLCLGDESQKLGRGSTEMMGPRARRRDQP